MTFSNIMCSVLGCSWLYNFTTLPNKSICKRCNAKHELNLSSLQWERVEKFDDKLGTDEEIKKRWHEKLLY